MDGLHVFLGTKAQYIKTAPLLRLMDERGVAYRLIDSGQHARLSLGLRAELGVREPDHSLGGDTDVDSVAQAARWATRLGTELVSRDRLVAGVFGGAGPGGICVVHGDTPSTLLSTLMARRAGLRVAHLEAGLRSHHVLHPFPEELIRLAVMRLASVLFAPDATAVANLERMRLPGRIVAVEANTSVDALRASAGEHAGAEAGADASGPAIVTMHRVENLHRRTVVDHLVGLVQEIATKRPVRFVVHGPTAEVLARSGADVALAAAGVELTPLAAHGVFVDWLRRAPFVITDGGSIQEECALIGVPTLLWRRRTERPDGLDANVVLSGYDDAVIRAFLAEPERWRRPAAPLDRHPSAQILDVLLEELAAGSVA